MGWTPTLIEELKKLWKKGLTTVEIGKSIGMTKNAVVGKAHRLGLKGRPSPIKPGRIQSKVIIEKKIQKEKQANLPKETIQKIKKTSGISLLDLKSNQCKWPNGDPQDLDFSFCGKPAVEGKPYCEEHCAIAYTGIYKPR